MDIDIRQYDVQLFPIRIITLQHPGMIDQPAGDKIRVLGSARYDLNPPFSRTVNPNFSSGIDIQRQVM